MNPITLTRCPLARLTLTAIVASLLFHALPVRSGELRIDYATGKDAPMEGYGKNADDYTFAPPIPIVINELVFVQMGSSVGNFRLRAVSEGGPVLRDEEYQRLRDQLEEVTSEVSGITHARIRFEIERDRVFNTQDLGDGRNVVTLVEDFKRTVGNNGSGKSAIGVNDHGDPVITEFDIRMDRNYTLRYGPNLLLHELLHGIGVNHSWLTQKCVSDLGLADATPPSIMSTGSGWNGLSPDDEATVARLYPRQWDRLSRTTGSVVGTVTDQAGIGEIYGAGLYLIDASDRPVAHRISGFGHVAPANLERQTSGDFVLEGIAPGVYDLLVANKTDPDVILARDGQGPDAEDIEYERTVGPGIIYLERRSDGSTGKPNAGDDFDDVDRPRGWVRRIEVRAGEIVDLGDVRFGEDRDFLEPTGGRDRIEATWTGAPQSLYWFDFWTGGRIAHRSGWVGDSRYGVELPVGRYAVRIYGWDGRTSRRLQNWVWVDYEPLVTTAHWDRLTRLETTGYRSSGASIRNYVEPLEYLVYSTPFGRSTDLRRAHGDHYTRPITPAYVFDGGSSGLLDESRGLGAAVFARQHGDEVWYFQMTPALSSQVAVGSR